MQGVAAAHGQLLKIEPLVTGDASGSAWSARYQQAYHSRFGALTQARWIYLEASGIGAQLRAGRPCSVLEIGFGLGLNTLVTADCATATGTPLRYHAIENDLIDAELPGELGYSQWLDQASLVDRLQQGLAASVRDADAPLGAPRDQRITLSLCVELQLTQGDATRVALPAQRYDAVYLDPFSPDVNPDCWSVESVGRLYAALKPGGMLTTYSVKGEVRRALAAVGFQVGKCPGPPGKREMLIASRLNL